MLLLETRDAQDKAQLTALRDAASIGVADIEAGRFRGFASAASLRRHLARLAEGAITGKLNATRSK